MATIYRFIVEQRTSGGSGDGTKPRASKGAGKKGKDLPLFGFGGSKGGVEHNRKMRAINPILNKVTNGVWEKGVRLSRASAGLIKRNTETGKISLGGPSIAIIIAFILTTVWGAFSKWNQLERTRANQLNAQNFRAMDNGVGTVHGAYKIMRDGFSGQIRYNENK